MLLNIERNISGASLNQLNNDVTSMREKIQDTVDTLSVKIEHEQTRSRLLDKLHEIVKFCGNFKEDMFAINSIPDITVVQKIKKLEVCLMLFLF